ncbi:Uncharacterized protein Adt_35820 [Abeliophyllum distichum]|uniref:Uncharacterized protein n=1 Tax=Abeliophyllum distichum TaxID=126358 RepID=A0ABD1QFT5_9LAMI
MEEKHAGEAIQLAMSKVWKWFVSAFDPQHIYKDLCFRYALTTNIESENTLDAHFDSVVHQDAFGHHEEHAGQLFMAQPDIRQSPDVHGTLYEQTSWPPHLEMLSTRMPRQNWLHNLPNHNWSHNLPLETDYIPTMPLNIPHTNYVPSSTHYVPLEFHDYMTNEQMNMIFAEKQSYFNTQLSSTRVGLFERCDQIQAQISSTNTYFFDRCDELQCYIDSRFRAFHAEQA